MATTVNAAFDQLLERLSATPGGTQAAQGYRARIEEALREDFGLIDFLRSGSHENGTSVAGYSSVDYFAVIPDLSPRPGSHQLLVAIAATLRTRFPNTGVRTDSLAVVLPFGRDPSEATKVIPVVEAGLTKAGHRQFVMPDGTGNWMTTVPDAHNEALRTTDQTHGGKVKALIRLLKGWKHLRSVPISSFYLELAVTEYAKTQDTIIYDIDLRNVFERLLATGLSPQPDPEMPGSIIAPCKSAPLQMEALSHVREAAAWSREAVTLNFGGNVPTAFLRWDRVFNANFPELER